MKISRITSKVIVNSNILEYVREDGSKELRIGRTASNTSKRLTNKVKKSVEDTLEFQAGRLVAWHEKLDVELTQQEAEELLVAKRKQLRAALADAIVSVKSDESHSKKKLNALIKRAKKAKLFSTIADMVMDDRFQTVLDSMESPQQAFKKVLS